MKKLFISVLSASVALSSCSTYQKQLNRTTAFLDSNPAVLAKLCATRYPVTDIKYVQGKDSVRVDTVIQKTDSIPCPPAKEGKVVYVKCPDQKTVTVYKSRVDTVLKKDLAEIAVVRGEKAVLSDSLVIVKEQLRETTKESKRKTWWIVGLSVLALSGVLFSFKSLFKLF